MYNSHIRDYPDSVIHALASRRPAVFHGLEGELVHLREAYRLMGFEETFFKEELVRAGYPTSALALEQVTDENVLDAAAKYLEEGTVQIAPLAYMRGRTLDNAFVILDEAQNTTLSQIKMFLTRMGRNAKFIVTGDVTQIDLPRKSDSGLVRTMEILREVEGIGIVEFDVRDIVRHPLVKHIVEAFDKCGTDLSKVEK